MVVWIWIKSISIKFKIQVHIIEWEWILNLRTLTSKLEESNNKFKINKIKFNSDKLKVVKLYQLEVIPFQECQINNNLKLMEL